MAKAKSFPDSSRSSLTKPLHEVPYFPFWSRRDLQAGKPPLLRYRHVRSVYFCISEFCKSVLCVSSSGCCETPFQAVARQCPRLCEGTASSHGSAQTSCGALVCGTQTLSLLSALSWRDQAVMFKRGPGVWRCSAPVVMCKSWFHSCSRQGKSRCGGHELLGLPAPAFSSLVLCGKALGNLETCCSCWRGGFMGCPAHWGHSPLLGLSLTQRALLSAAFLSVTFGRLIQSFIESPVAGGGKCRAAAGCSSSCLSLSSPYNIFAAK